MSPALANLIRQKRAPAFRKRTPAMIVAQER
jgi:hypothetical protein